VSILDAYPEWQQELLRRELRLPAAAASERRLSDAEWERARREQHAIIDSFRQQGREQALREIALRPRRKAIVARMEADQAAWLRSMYGPPVTSRNPVIAIVGRRIGMDGPKGKRGFYMADLERELARFPRAKEIALIIDCEGGSPVESKAVYSRLRTAGVPIAVRVIGVCASAATDLLLSGDYREASSGALFCIHETALDPPPKNSGERWTADKHRGIAAWLDQHSEDRLHFIAARTGTEIEDLRPHHKAEHVLAATAARRLGLIHVIVDGDEHGMLCRR
jgi:ATP-dependent protease ClpP protease subunit